MFNTHGVGEGCGDGGEGAGWEGRRAGAHDGLPIPEMTLALGLVRAHNTNATTEHVYV